jgi:hypothetical protein
MRADPREGIRDVTGEELVRLGYLLFLRPLRPKWDWIGFPRYTATPRTHGSVGDSEHFVVLGGSYPGSRLVLLEYCFSFFLDDDGIGCFWLCYIPLASLPVRYPGQFAGCEGTVRRRLVLLGSFNCFDCQGLLSQEIVIIQGWFLVVQYDLGVLMLCLRIRCLEI